MKEYKQFLFTNERLLPYRIENINYPLTSRIIAKNIVGLPKVTGEYLIYSNTNREVFILPNNSGSAKIISLPSMKKVLDSSEMQLVVSDGNVLVYLNGQVFTISLIEKKIIDQNTVCSTGLDTVGCVYTNQITYNPSLTIFGIFDLSKKKSVWETTLTNYCIKTCGNEYFLIIQDGPFLIRTYNKDNGNELWTFDTKKFLNDEQKYFMGINSLMALYQNNLIFGSNDHLFCLDSQSGNVVWSKKITGFESANMSVFDNGMITCISSTCYYEIDTETGDVSSNIDIEKITRNLNASLFTRPLVTIDQVITFSAMTSSLLIFSRNGFKLLYQLDVYNTHEKKKYHPAMSAGQTPLLINTSVFAVDMDGFLREYK